MTDTLSQCPSVRCNLLLFESCNMNKVKGKVVGVKVIGFSSYVIFEALLTQMLILEML